MSFRRFGGINYAPKHNIVSSNYNTSNNLLVTQNVGQPNSYIEFLSDISGNINIDISGNIICNGNLYVSGDVDISGNTQMGGNLDVSSNVYIEENLDVNGNTQMGGNLDVSSNVFIAENLDVSGNITGQTGTFQNLIVSKQIEALGGITGSTGSFQNLIVSNQIEALGGITGSTGSFQNLIVSNQIEALGCITGPTGSFSYLSSTNSTYLATNGQYVGIGKNAASYNLDVSGNINFTGSLFKNGSPYTGFTGLTGSSQWITTGNDIYYNEGNVGIGTTSPQYILDVSGDARFTQQILTQGGITGSTGSFQNLIVSNHIEALGGITGPTGSFQNLIVSKQIEALGGITGPTGSFQNLIVSNQIKALGGITGPTGSFQNLIVSNQIEALGGITGPTGSFQNLIVSNNTYLATTNGQSVGIGKNNITSGFVLDVSGNTNISGNYLQNLGTLNTNTFSSGFLTPSSLTFNASNANQMFLNTYLLMNGGNVTNWENIEPRLQLYVDTSKVSYISFNPYNDNGSNPGELAFGYNNTEVIRISKTSNGCVGIGTTTPSYTLDVSGNTQFTTAPFVSSILTTPSSTQLITKGYADTAYTQSSTNILVTNNTWTGTNSFMNSVGIGKTTSSIYALDISGNTNLNGVLNIRSTDASDSSNNTFLRFYGDSSINYIQSAYYQPMIFAAYGYDISNNPSLNPVMYLDIQEQYNRVGINKINPQYTLDVNGNANISGQITASSFNSTSDYRLKTDIKSLENYNIDNLKPVEYDINGKHDTGFIAHEVQEHYPFLVDGEKDGEKMQSINYNGFIALLVKEIQTLKNEIKELKQNLSVIK